MVHHDSHSSGGGPFGTIFDRDVATYESARPPYPPELFALLEGKCGIGEGTRVLEIGPGSGQATLPLLHLGAEVVAVEAGPRMADRLRERTAGRPCEVIGSRFEEAHLGARRFDVAVAATSFHWVDAAVAIPKLAGHLVDGGWLALWWTIYRDAGPSDSGFDELVHRIARRIRTRDDPDRVSHGLQTEQRAAEITAGGRFRMVERAVVPLTVTHTPASLRALFATFSD